MGVQVSPPPSSSHPSELSQCTGFECPVSCIDLELVIYFTYGNIHVSLLFFQTKFFSQIKSIFFFVCTTLFWEALLRTMLVEVMEFQLSYLKSSMTMLLKCFRQYFSF